VGAVALIGERRQVSESAPIAGYGEQLNNQAKDRTMTTEITFQGHALTCACGYSGRDVLPAYGCDAMCVSCIADTANACWPHTRLDAGSDRETVVSWLAGNDRNGCYLDDDMIAEGWAPMTLADAWRQVAIAHEIADPDHDPTPLA